MREGALWPAQYLWWIVSQPKTIYENYKTTFMLHIWKFPKIHDYFMQLFRPVFYPLKSFGDVMKTCIHFSKTNFYFKFTWSTTIWSYTFKLNNNTFHFCACQMKTQGSFIVFINPSKTFRWNFFFFEIIQSFSRKFEIFLHTPVRDSHWSNIWSQLKNFEFLFRALCKTFESSVKINILNFYDSNNLVQSASEAGTK